MGGGVLGTLKVLFGGDTSDFDKAAAHVEKSSGSLISTMGVLGAASAAIFGAGAVLNQAAQFDSTMKNIQAVTQASATDMGALNSQLLALGAGSVAGPQAVALAYYDVAGGVSDASVRMATLEAAIRLSEAGQADLGASTKGLISVMNSYSLSADQASMVSDVFAQTVGKGVGTMDEFVAAMSPMAGLMAATGQSFADVGAMMAYMTTKGDTAALAATKIKAATTALLNPNEAMTKALRAVNLEQDAMIEAGYKQVAVAKYSADQISAANTKLAEAEAALAKTKSPERQAKLNKQIADYQTILSGANSKVFAWVDSNGKAVKVTGDFLLKTFGLSKTLDMLSDATGGSQTQMAKLLGSTEAMQAAAVLAGDGFTKFNSDFETSMTGITEAQRKIQLESFNAQWGILTNTLGAFAISAGQAVLPALTTIVGGFNMFLGDVQKIGLGAALEKWWNMGMDWLHTNGPILLDGALKVAVALAGGVVGWLQANGPNIQAGLQGWWNGAMTWLTTNGPILMDTALKAAVNLGGDIAAWMKTNLPDAGLAIGGWLKGAADWLRVEGPKLMSGAMAAIFGGGGGDQGSSLSEAVRNQMQPSMFDNVLNNFKTMFGAVFGPGGFIGGLIEGMFGLEKGTLGKFFTEFFGEKGPIATAIEAGKKWFGGFIDKIGDISTAISNVFSKVFDMITTPFKKVLKWFGEQLVSIASKVPQLSGLADLGQGLINFGTTAADVGIRVGNSGGVQYGPEVPGRAVGGPVSPGGTYRVGERGPELVTFGRAGSVTPNKAMTGGGLAINGPITINGVEDLDGLLDQLMTAAGRRNMAFGG